MFFGPGHPFFGPVHVFWTWPDFFSGPGGAKNVGDVPVIACVFSGPCKKVGPACIFAGPRDIDSQTNCF